MDEFVAYIDEAGDEGFGKLRAPNVSGQSRWLAIGAVIVSRENDRLLPAWRDEILAHFPQRQKRDLHFRELKHEQRVVACRYLANKPFGVCVVCSNKETILDSSKKEVFKQKGYLYNYIVRFLLERVSAIVQEKARRVGGDKARLRIVFSRRGGTDYQVMKEYLYLMRDGREVLRPKRGIVWDVLDIEDVKVENHARWAGLQVADVVTSATYWGLEPNRYGMHEPRYAMELKDKYIKLWGSKLDSGLTVIPPVRSNPLSSEQRAFIQKLTE